MSKPNNPAAFPFVYEVTAPEGYGRSINICQGMTLRDYFAAKASGSEVADLIFRHASKHAKEMLAGREMPANDSDRAKHQVEMIQFEIDVTAKIRFMVADAMLKAREA